MVQSGENKEVNALTCHNSHLDGITTNISHKELIRRP